MPRLTRRPESGFWWQPILQVVLVVVAIVSIWYALGRREYEVLVVSLPVVILLAALSFAPWRRTDDAGAVVLWLLGGLLVLIGLLATWRDERVVVFMAGIGSGVILGLAAARHVYPKPTP